MSWLGRLINRHVSRQSSYDAALVAMRRNDRARLEGILSENPALVNQAYCLSGSLLHNAALDGQAEFAEMLISRGAVVNAASTRDNETPLHFAAEAGKLETVRLLIERGADVNAVSHGGTALDLAAMKGQTDIVRLLSDRGAEGPPLHVAAMVGNAAETERLLSRGTSPDSLARHGMTPLHWAALGGDTGCAAARQLVAHGADLDASDDWGRSPLHCASESGACEMAALLLDSGASIDWAHPHIGTPLHSALSHDKPDVAALLIERGAAVDARDMEGRTPLKLACARGFAHVVKLLLDRGADLTPGTDFSALHFAAYNGHLEIAKLLIDHGADVNAPNGEGRTALQEAIAEGHTAIVDLLRQHETRSRKERNDPCS